MTKILALLALCYAGLASANNEFSDFFNSLETLSADFSQQTYNDSGELLNNTSGYFHFKRPAQFVWQTQTPIQQMLLLTNNELWLIDTELEQASKRTMDDLNNTPLYWLINRPEQLQSIPQQTDNEEGIHWYATPEENQLSFGFKDKKLSALKLTNQLSQKVLIRFSKLKINPALDQDAFALKLGPDFDVIR